MIPYSMDFTDAYTARLKELGATAGTAGSYETQAIADVRAGIKDNEKLKTASDKVSAAMTALADASEHTGQASAFHQIVLRFADQLDSDDDTSESGAADDFCAGHVAFRLRQPIVVRESRETAVPCATQGRTRAGEEQYRRFDQLGR